MNKTAEEILREKIENELGDLSSDDNFLRLIHFPNVAVLAAMEEYAAQFAAPPPASEGEIAEDLIIFINSMKTKQTLTNGCEIETIHIPSLIHKINESLATLPTREPEAKDDDDGWMYCPNCGRIKIPD